MKSIEHLGIAVNNLDSANDLYTKLLGIKPYKSEIVVSEGVATSFFQIGESKIELLESTDPESAISRFLTKKGEGIHHVAFEVDDIVTEIERMKNEGFVVLNDKPTRGADNKLVCFIHPKSTNGVLIELCQEIKE